MQIRSNQSDIELLAAAADVAESYCELNHGPDTKQEDFPAVNAFIVPLGRQLSEVEFQEERKLVIPVCQDCADALQGEAWTLIFCLECSASQWVLRELAKNSYRHHVLWVRGCPECTNKFGGLYFADTDFPNAPSEDL